MEEINKENVNLSKQPLLPAGWKWVKLGEVCEFLDNMRVPINDAERQKRMAGKKESELYPYYGANGQVGWIDGYLFDDELVLLAEDGGFFGSAEKPIAYKVNGKCWVNNHAHVLKAKSNVIEVDWLYFSLAIRPDVIDFVSGTTRPKLNQELASIIPIPLPPLDEQKQIAAKIQELMDEVDRARTACEKQLEAAKSLLSAYLREVFESPDAQKWEKKKLGEVVKKEKFAIVDGPFGTQLHKYDYVDSGIPLIRIQNIGSFCNFIFDNLIYITREKFESLKRSGIYPQDILLAKTGATIGKVCLCPSEIKEALIASSCAKISLDKDRASPDFILFFLFSNYGYQQIIASSVGSTRSTINLDSIRGIDIPLLPLPEQQRIASYLKEKMDEVEELKSSLEKQLEAINSLPQSIFFKAFKGEL